MIDIARIYFTVVFHIDAAPIGHIFLRNIEHIPVGIMCGHAGKWPGGRPLQPFHRRIVCAQPLINCFGILDLNAEMIQSGVAPCPPWIDVQSDITIAYRNSARGTRLGRRVHAEHRLVKLTSLGIVFADHREVIEFCEQMTSLRQFYAPHSCEAVSAQLTPCASSGAKEPPLSKRRCWIKNGRLWLRFLLLVVRS